MPWIKSEGAAAWALFVAGFLIVAIWESRWPKRQLSYSAERRWGNNALLLVVSSVAGSLLLRLVPVLVAVSLQQSRWGLLNRNWLPFALRCALAFVVLDFVHYATHRAFHSVPWLWRVHEVHHSDPDYDVSTGARFHPIEVVLVEGATLAAVALTAAPAIAVFSARLSTSAFNWFVHANASLPEWAEKALRPWLITPDLHRIHHSDQIAEQSRNFGQTFSWWDRFFGTFLTGRSTGSAEGLSNAPLSLQEGFSTGLKGLQNEGSLGLGFMLAEPFKTFRQSQDAVAATLIADPAPRGRAHSAD